jgi:tetratricopeptide (TPR) repeat protein
MSKWFFAAWYKAVRWFLGLETGGSLYRVKIGANAQAVAVGSNIVQIGHLTLPTFPFLLLAGVVTAYFAYQTWQTRGPVTMTGEFNVAIAEFGERDSNGRIHHSEQAEDLSRWLYGRIHNEFGTLFQEINAQLWHDDLGLGVKLGPIEGKTAAERSANAAALARRIQADVLIYGYLQPGKTGGHFVPEFYVSDWREADELVGPHQLGAPISVSASLDSLAESLKVMPRLSDRTKALALFVTGLALETAGYPERALAQFQAAAELPDWRDDEGKEILYLFLSREAFLLWRQGQDREEEVRRALEQALRLNPRYGRAYIGLGNYHREKAERLLTELQRLKQAEGLASEAVLAASGRFETEIQAAIAAYQQAIALAAETPQGQVAVKGYLALGGAIMAQALAAESLQQYGRAADQYQQALAAYQHGLALAEPTDYRHQGLAHLSLGLVYYQQANLRSRRTDLPTDDAETLHLLAQAADEMMLCVQYADQDEIDWFLQQIKAEQCLPLLAKLK